MGSMAERRGGGNNKPRRSGVCVCGFADCVGTEGAHATGLDIAANCYYSQMMELVWDEAKRQRNLWKHGLDFADAGFVLDSGIRMDVVVSRNGEERTQSFAYVFGMLRVLTVVHVAGDACTRVISFRSASTDERVAYHAWLESDD
ncbi:MAG: BrnT family toxin [Pseudoxanthomonas sp.]